MHELPADPSVLLSIGFIGLSLLLAGFWSWAIGTSQPVGERSRLRALGPAAIALWMTVTGLLATRPLLHDFTPFPPPIMGWVTGGFVLTLIVGSTSIGRQLATLPLAVLVGFQGFRVPVELLLHRAWAEGLMPIQMSYYGRNFDVVSGITALGLGLWLIRRDVPRWCLWAWNVVSLALLLNVVTIAILSFPTPLRAFDNEPANVWVTFFPFVWLPTVLVTSALLGHILVFRRLLSDRHSLDPLGESRE